MRRAGCIHRGLNSACHSAPPRWASVRHAPVASSDALASAVSLRLRSSLSFRLDQSYPRSAQTGCPPPPASQTGRRRSPSSGLLNMTRRPCDPPFSFHSMPRVSSHSSGPDPLLGPTAAAQLQSPLLTATTAGGLSPVLGRPFGGSLGAICVLADGRIRALLHVSHFSHSGPPPCGMQVPADHRVYTNLR